MEYWTVRRHYKTCINDMPPPTNQTGERKGRVRVSKHGEGRENSFFSILREALLGGQLPGRPWPSPEGLCPGAGWEGPGDDGETGHTHKDRRAPLHCGPAGDVSGRVRVQPSGADQDPVRPGFVQADGEEDLEGEEAGQELLLPSLIVRITQSSHAQADVYLYELN